MLPIFCLCQRGLAQGPTASGAPDLRKIAVRAPWSARRWVKHGAVSLYTDEPRWNGYVFVKRRGHITQGILSPDSKWVLNLPDPTLFKTVPTPFGVLRIQDGSYSTRHPMPNSKLKTSVSNPLWMPDSRHWIRLWIDERGDLYPVVLDRSSHASAQNAIGTPKATVPHWDLVESHLIGFIGPDRVLAQVDIVPYAVLARHLRLYSFEVGGSADQVKEFSISFSLLPEGEPCYAAPAVLSPDGTKIAWLLGVSPPGQASVHVCTLLCCRANGAGMRVIGQTMLKKTHLPSVLDQPFALQWLPDGKRIRFIYHNSVWTVPVQAGP